jgi:hypothetical protein
VIERRTTSSSKKNSCEERDDLCLTQRLSM